MSYVTLATKRFDEMVAFYGETLDFPLASGAGRAGAQGRLFDLGGGLRLEILDALAQKQPLHLGAADDRCHLVIETPNVDARHARLPFPAPAPVTTSWGARLFRVQDPDGTAVWFLQWLDPNAR
jgi:catechol 2,3-dioxygenase-like lactoylglutathione lyase family enzyme